MAHWQICKYVTLSGCLAAMNVIFIAIVWVDSITGLLSPDSSPKVNLRRVQSLSNKTAQSM